MKTRLFAVDMDGTLLTDSKTFDHELLDHVLVELNRRNGYFVVATGNQYPKCLEYMKDFRDRGIYFIAENGAYIADGTQDLLISGFADETVTKVLKVLEGFPEIGIVISSHEGAFIPEDRAEVITSIVQEHLDYLGADFPHDIDYLSFINRFYPGTTTIRNYSQLAGKNVVKFALQSHRQDTENLLGRLIDKLPSNVVPVQSGFGAIDLISRGVNKGTALTWLCEKLSVESQEVMAFGDASNDIEMLHFAGTGVAMGNATPAVKTAADIVIGENKDGAVLKYIAETLKK